MPCLRLFIAFAASDRQSQAWRRRFYQMFILSYRYIALHLRGPIRRFYKMSFNLVWIVCLDGQNRAMFIAEPLARVIEKELHCPKAYLVAPSTGWMLYYLCFSPSTAIGPPPAIGSAIGRPYLALSRFHTGRSSRLPRSKPLRGLNRATVVL